MAQWAPYYEKMIDELRQMALVEEEKEDLTGNVQGTISRFSHGKVNRAGLGGIQADAVQYGMCLVIPKEPYVLPLYVSVWEERAEEIRMMVDVMPTVDILVDEPYRKRYIEPLGDLWDKYSHLAGICPEEDDELRSACSIIYTAGRIPLEKEGMRLAALAAHTKYLKGYGAYLQSAETVDDEEKLKEVRLKTEAVSGIIRTHVAESAGRAIGAEAAEKLVKSLL